MTNKKSKHSNERKNRLRIRSDLLKSAGFTIVELMIASVVFSLILVLITYGVIQFNRAYYGGMVQSTTQTVARSIMDNLSQSIQFDGGPITTSTSPPPHPPTWYGICIGNQFYQYQLGLQLTTSGTLDPTQQTNQALLLTNTVSCSGLTPGVIGGPTPGSPPPGGSELLGEHMRLANLNVQQISGTNLYKINVRVVYGDADLLCSLSVANSCKPNVKTGATAPDAECKTNIGTPQFCAVSDLTTTVEKRIN